VRLIFGQFAEPEIAWGSGGGAVVKSFYDKLKAVQTAGLHKKMFARGLLNAFKSIATFRTAENNERQAVALGKPPEPGQGLGGSSTSQVVIQED